MAFFNPSRDRRPRWAFVVLFALLLTAGGLTGCAPGSLPFGQTPTATATQTATATMTPSPTVTFTPTFTPTPTQDPCPINPNMWTAEPMFPDGKGQVLDLVKLRPLCAYEGLKRSLAVFILMRNGYTYREAMQTVGWTVENEYGDMPQYEAYTFYADGGFKISDPDMTYWFVYGTDKIRKWVYGEKSRQPVGQYYLFNCVKDYEVDDLLQQRTVTVPYACTFLVVYDEMPVSIEDYSTSEGEVWSIMPSAFNYEGAVKRGVPQDAVGYAEAYTFVYVGNGQWIPSWTPRYLPLERSPKPYKVDFMRYFDTKEEMEQYLALLRGHDVEFGTYGMLDLDWVRQTYGVEPKPLDEAAIAGKQVYPNWSEEEVAMRIKAVKEVLDPFLCRTVPIEKYCGPKPTPTPTPDR